MANEAECRGKGWVERDSERVAHSEEYLRHAVDASGLLLRSLQVVPLLFGLRVKVRARVRVKVGVRLWVWVRVRDMVRVRVSAP